jgi:hypothetical protein
MSDSSKGASAAAAAAGGSGKAPEMAAEKAGESKDDCPWCKYMKGGNCRETFEVRADSSI